MTDLTCLFSLTDGKLQCLLINNGFHHQATPLRRELYDFVSLFFFGTFFPTTKRGRLWAANKLLISNFPSQLQSS